MKTIIEQFKKVNELQQKLVPFCDEKIALIAEKKMMEAQAVIQKELLVLHDLEQALNQLKKVILDTCHDYGIPNGKLETLFPFATTEEKEQLMACQRYAIHCEQITKNKLKNADRQVQVEMALPEILHRTRVQHMKETGGQTTLFNQKF